MVFNQSLLGLCAGAELAENRGFRVGKSEGGRFASLQSLQEFTQALSL